MTNPHRSDDAIEQLLRATLAENAADAPVTLRNPANVTATPRHRWVLAAGAVAAAAAVALAVPWASLRGGDQPSPGPLAVSGQGADTSTVVAPTGWRTESYAGVQLDVPATWGWGGSPGPGAAPMTGDGSMPSMMKVESYCGIFGAFVLPDGTANGNAQDKPFVGRPMMMTDACGDDPNGHPSVDAVWFTTPLPVGEQRFDDGQVALTRQIGDVTFTVFSRDDQVREQIAASAEPVAATDAHGCPTQLPPGTPSGEATAGDTASQVPAGLSTCVYRQGVLLASSSADRAAAEEYLSATTAATPVTDRACMAIAIDGQDVRLGVRTEGGPTRWDGVDPVCGLIAIPAGSIDMTDATVSPWAAPLLKAYVVTGPQQGDWNTWFRGILG